ncbi:MAG: apolipoprotein N-acyltransferase [Spirochaetota bacterium]|nr:apolipoprotein N-acyltransferase [Spirochaetota bacterium]
MGVIVQLLRKYYYVLTGLLIFLSSPSYDHWILKGFPFFAWVSMIPLFIFVRDKGYKEILFSSFIATFIGNYLSYRWIGSFGADVAGGYYIVLAFLIPSLTVFSVTKIIIAEYLSRSFENLRVIIYPSTWISIDLIQSIGHLAFPWTYPGYSQYPFTSFIQVSSFIGIMGINFILILGNSIVADLIYTMNSKRLKPGGLLRTAQFIRLLIFLLVFSFVLIYGWYVLPLNQKTGEDELRIAIIQSCISPWEKWKTNRFRYLNDLERLTRLSLHEEPDIIIWSESATLEHISYDYYNERLNPFEKRVLDIASSSNTPLLTGEIGIIEDILNKRHFPQNNAVLIDEYGTVVDTYPKIHLVPFGEWFPYEKWLPFIKELLVSFGGSSFIPGDKPVVFEVKDKKFGVLICYEGIFYRLCRRYNELGVDFLVNITNDGWTDSYSGHMQHFSASIFRAIENGLWYVRAGNTGYTTLIDPYGRVTKSIPILHPGYIVGNINFALKRETFYSKHGDIFLYICMGFIFLASFIIFFRIIQSYLKDKS